MVTSAQEALVGQTIDGRYQVLALLARGGMATVYQALDLRLDRTVALKVMHRHLAEDPDFVARFHREAKSAARLTHPHVVAVYDQGTAAGLIYLAMEYVPGRNLRDVIHQFGPLSGEQALALQIPAFTMAGVLLIGGIITPWLAKVRGVRAAVTGLVTTMVLFFLILTFAAPHISKPGTRALAEMVTARAKPGDRVLHYHEFFHDFTFYARRVVDVVAFKGELELEEDAVARASGRFMDEPKFRELWAGSGRVWAVARKKDLKPLFGDATFRYHLIGETRDHSLLSNQP